MNEEKGKIIFKDGKRYKVVDEEPNEYYELKKQSNLEQKALVFRAGQEYKVVVEDYSTYKNSHFADIYEQAGKQTMKIISRNKEVEKDKKYSGDFYNNILAFIGDRGTGKTSCMQSFSNLLLNENYLESLNKKNMKFNDLGIVDPSMFDDRGNLLELVLATMFKKFKKNIENNNSNENQKRKTLESFNKVYKNLQHLNGKKEDLYKEDAIDALIKLSAANDFKSNFKELVDLYLGYMNSDSSNSENILIIQIDDIDLNTSHAYEMVEQIRKYMILPNMVILMAVKLPQLFDAIKQQLIIENKALLDQNSIDVKELASMTEKYLEKLIPVEHRLFLPKLEDFDRSLPIVVESADSNKKPFRADSVEAGVRELIYTRTGMYFTSPKYHDNYIVPNNLRELNNLVVVLYNLEKIKDTADEKTKKLFKHYFDVEIEDEAIAENRVINILDGIDENYLKIFACSNMELIRKKLKYEYSEVLTDYDEIINRIYRNLEKGQLKTLEFAECILKLEDKNYKKDLQKFNKIDSIHISNEEFSKFIGKDKKLEQCFNEVRNNKSLERHVNPNRLFEFLIKTILEVDKLKLEFRKGNLNLDKKVGKTRFEESMEVKIMIIEKINKGIKPWDNLKELQKRAGNLSQEIMDLRFTKLASLFFIENLEIRNLLYLEPEYIEIVELTKDIIRYGVEETTYKRTYNPFCFIKKAMNIDAENYYVKEFVLKSFPKELRAVFEKYEIITTKPYDEKIKLDLEIKQLEWFKNYFIENWCYNNLSSKDLEIILTLDQKGVDEKNKYIILQLKIKLEKLLKEKEYNQLKKTFEGYEEVVEMNNTSINLSLGDMIGILECYKKYDMGDEAQKFIYSIETLYSLLLYKYHLKKNSNRLKIDGKDYTYYDILFGGGFYNHKFISILKKEDNITSRDERVFKIEKFDDKKSDNIENSNVREFIRLFLKNISNDKYRESSEMWHDKKVDYRQNQTYFNILFGFYEVNLEGENDSFYIGNIDLIRELLDYKFYQKVYPISNDEYGEFVVEFWNQFIKFYYSDGVVFFSATNSFVSNLYREFIFDSKFREKLISILNLTFSERAIEIRDILYELEENWKNKVVVNVKVGDFFEVNMADQFDKKIKHRLKFLLEKLKSRLKIQVIENNEITYENVEVNINNVFDLWKTKKGKKAQENFIEDICYVIEKILEQVIFIDKEIS